MKEIKAKDIKQNMFSMLHDNWGIVCAGDENSSSGMTVSWGASGIMWEKPTVTVYIRPQRHTKVLIDANDRFSLSFLPEDMRHISQYFGKVSASDGTDKFKGAGAKEHSKMACRMWTVLIWYSSAGNSFPENLIPEEYMT